ncbi:hypothetical protein WJX79_009391 [Trebouxia sp. C0005]
MSNAQSPASSPAGSSKYAQELAEFRQRISQDGHVEAQLRAGGEPGLLGTSGIDDETLLRWLKAEKYSVSKAEKRLRAHAQWRKEYVPLGRIEESEILPELEADKTFLQGCDKNPTGKTCAIFDLRGLGFDAMDRPVLQAVFDLLQNHYPERLGKLWMYEAPTMFWTLWHLVSPFIDPETKQKVVFVNSKSAISEFQKAIDPSVLPTDYGGQAELIPLQVYVKDHLPKTEVNHKG